MSAVRQCLIGFAASLALVAVAGAQERGASERDAEEAAVDSASDTRESFADEALGKAWGLSTAEIATLRQIELTSRYFAGEHPPPPLVLGMYARSESEKARYARLYLERYMDYGIRALDMAAMIRRVGNPDRYATEVDIVTAAPSVKALLAENDISLNDIAMQALKGAAERPAAPGDRERSGGVVRYFAPLDCADACATTLESLIGRVRLGVYDGLDIVVTGTGVDDIDAIRAWADERRVPRGLVPAPITLNYDSPDWVADRGGDARTLPVALDPANREIEP